MKRLPSPCTTAALPSMMGLLSTAALGALPALAQIPPGLPVASVTVKEANGSPVEGATVCVGTQLDFATYGQGVTSHLGTVSLDAMLPEGPTTIYFTASKDGRGVQGVQEIASPVVPVVLTAQLQLPASPGGPACPGGGSGPTAWLHDALQGIQVTPSLLSAGQAFEITLILKRPPPVPVPVALESSNPRLLRLPPEITVRPGERTATVRTEVSRDVRRAETLTIQARAGGGRAPAVRAQIRVQPADSEPSPRNRP